MRRRYVFVPLLTALVLLNLIEPSKTPVERFNVPVDTAELPDYYMEQMAIKHYDEQGLLQAEISAPSFSHYLGQKQAHLVDPNIKLYTTNGDVWEVNAGKGRILDETQDLSLESGVQIQLGKPAGTEVLLITERVYYEFSEHRVWNQTPVVLDSSVAKGTALGMLIDLNTQKFELHRDVELSFKE